MNMKGEEWLRGHSSFVVRKNSRERKPMDEKKHKGYRQGGYFAYRNRAWLQNMGYYLFQDWS